MKQTDAKEAAYEPLRRPARNQAEEQLRERNELLTSVFEHAPFFVAVLRGPEHVFEMANPAYLRLVGGRDVIGERVVEAIPEAESQGFVALLDDVYSTGEPHIAREVPILLREAGGGRMQRHVLNFVYQPLRDRDGGVIGIHVQGTDVTEQVEAREVVHENERRLRTLFTSIDEGYCLCEMVLGEDGRPVDYRFLEVNPLFEEMTGLVDPVGRTAYGLVPNLEPHWVETYARAALEGEQFRFESGSDAMGRWFDVFVTPTEPHGRFMLVFKDVTERRRVEASLRRMNETLERRVQERTEDLEERNKELQNFAYVASHDLREPLRKIQTFAGMLQQDAAPKLDQEERYFLERIGSAAARMNGLLGDLLAFSRLATKQAAFVPVYLGEVIRDVLTDFEVAVRETGAEVEVDADVTVEADRPQLRQLLTNLVGNAFKYRREDVVPRVRIEARTVRGSQDGDRAVQESDSAPSVCRLVVEDNGIGFEERYRERIFEPFQRLHGRSTYEGTGMGLALVRRIAERHGGSVSARSTPGRGSTFIVELPVQRRGTTF